MYFRKKGTVFWGLGSSTVEGIHRGREYYFQLIRRSQKGDLVGLNYRHYES